MSGVDEEGKRSRKAILAEKVKSLPHPTMEPGEPAGFGKHKELVTRIITGVTFSVVVGLCLLLGKISALVIVMLLAGVCAYEFYRMMHVDGKLPNDIVGITTSVLYPLVGFIGGPRAAVYMLALTMLLMALMLVWYVFNPRVRITDIALTVFGALYCGLMFSTLVFIRASEAGYIGGFMAFGVILSVWVNDSFAYLVGSKFGKHKLAPKISPKKSWEGFIAGIIGSILVWYLMTLFIPTLSFPLAMIGGVLCGFVAVFGDFVESRIKRGAGVKDSGNFLPGHGGFLDRCDSTLFVSVIAFFVLLIGGAL